MLVGICALMTLAALAAILLPLLRGSRPVAERGAYDRAVYRDQLKELDRDFGRGLIGEREVETARIEIQRRLLGTENPLAPASTRRAKPGRSIGLGLATSALVAAGAVGLYLRVGDPGLPDMPFAGRVLPAIAAAADIPPPAGSTQLAAAQAAAHIDMKDAADKLRQKLIASPANADGWLLYARTESSLGDWARATGAYEKTLALGNKGAIVYAGYGEMLVLAAQGIVSPAAHEAFAAARTADAANDVARFYLALADAQAGEIGKAIAEWQSLAADTPDDSPMREEISRRVIEAAQSGGIPAPPLPKGKPPEAAEQAGGPTDDQMAAAGDMAPADRDKMIGGMISGLAAKLQANPNDLDGWTRLGRAYFVQGDADKAADAYDHALKLKPNDADIELSLASSMLSRLQPSDPLPPRAVGLLRDAARVSPEAPEVLWYLGVLAAREGRPDEARQSWTKLLAALPNEGEDHKMVQAALVNLKAP